MSEFDQDPEPPTQEPEPTGSVASPPDPDSGADDPGDDSDEKTAPETIGGVELLELLGEGGLGKVYLGRDPRVDRKVVVRVLAEELQDDASLRERFLREARAVAPLEHPNVAGVLIVSEQGGRAFVVMEHVEGESLAARLERDGPLSLPEAVRLVAAAASGVAEAHRRGIVHLDLEPANLIQTPQGGVKVLGFGLARREAAEPDQRADVFGLAATLVALVGGAAPSAGTDETQLGALFQAQGQVLLPELGRLLERSLAKDVDQRPETGDVFALQLAEAAKEIVPDVPVPKPPPTSSGGAGQGHRALRVALLSVVALLLVAWGVWFAVTH